MKKGFTLVELAIVLVIIGLLIGGILIGQSLIDTAKVRTLTSEMEQYKIVYQMFEDRFHGKPGDISNASTYFPTCDTPATNCDGDGDGVIEWFTERLRAWQLISQAGFLEASYTGETAGVPQFAPDVNIPSSAIEDIVYHTSYADGGGGWHGIRGQVLQLSGYLGDGNGLGQGAVTPADALAIDKKLDDGLYNSGEVMIYNSGSCFVAGGYNVSNEDRACRIWYIIESY